MYIRTSVWGAKRWNSHFQHFFAKKQRNAKKSNKFPVKSCKKTVFLSLHQNPGRVFCSLKTPLFTFESLLLRVIFGLLGGFFWNKTLDQHLGVNLKNPFFCSVYFEFVTFLHFFFAKNAVNGYFNQHLGCTAPKRWLKYTTLGIKCLIVLRLFISCDIFTLVKQTAYVPGENIPFCTYYTKLCFSQSLMFIQTSDKIYSMIINSLFHFELSQKLS